MNRCALFVSILFAGLGFGQEFKVGSKISDFPLTDIQGQAVNYSALKGDTTVILFVATKCPVSNGYNERMKALYGDYSAKGVHFVFINSNNSEPAVEVAQHAKDHGFS